MLVCLPISGCGLFPPKMPPHLPVPTQVIHTAEPSLEGSGQPKSIEICLLKHSLAAVNSPFTVAGFFRFLYPRAFCLPSHSVYRFCYIRKHFCSKTISDLLPQTYKDGRVRSLTSPRLHPSSPAGLLLTHLAWSCKSILKFDKLMGCTFRKSLVPRFMVKVKYKLEILSNWNRRTSHFSDSGKWDGGWG